MYQMVTEKNVNPQIYTITSKYCPFTLSKDLPTNTNLKCYNTLYDCCKSSKRSYL